MLIGPDARDFASLNLRLNRQVQRFKVFRQRVLEDRIDLLPFGGGFGIIVSVHQAPSPPHDMLLF